MSEHPQIHCYTEGHLAFVVLDRPQQLNALSWAMNTTLLEHLLLWQDDPVIKVVIITSSSTKAFCAGGDIKMLYQNAKTYLDDCIDFFALEYRLNLLIANYPKPIIAFCQGITMGGGCGIAFHASHAIAGDQIKCAMPETKIGLFPDIGASYVLPRLKDHLGYYLGLTGATIGQVDVLYAELLPYGMTEAQWQQCLQDLKTLDWQQDPFATLNAYLESYQAKQNHEADLKKYHHWINRLFSQASLTAIVNPTYDCDTAEQRWRNNIAAQLRKASPQSLLMTWQAFNNGKYMSLEEVLQQDLRLAKACLTAEDLFIGIKACLIDRNQPQWSKPSIEAYVVNDIAHWFCATEKN